MFTVFVMSTKSDEFRQSKHNVNRQKKSYRIFCFVCVQM